MKLTKKSSIRFLCLILLLLFSMYSIAQAASVTTRKPVTRVSATKNINPKATSTLMTSITPTPTVTPTPTATPKDTPTPTPSDTSEEQIDDWEYSPQSPIYSTGLNNNNSLNSVRSINSGASANYSMSTKSMTAVPESSSIGFSVGGAKDVTNFRENIKNKYFPQFSSLTYEGLFYNYYFDTGEQKETSKLFSPSYSYAVSSDPISKQDEYYLSVGLNSGLKQEDFKRKKLNLTIVLDISGSMGSNMDSYYYDQGTTKDEDYGKTKMEVACKSIVSLLGHLNGDDRFGMVLFDNYAYMAKPMNKVKKTNMSAIKKHILDLSPQGGTYFEAGYKTATKLYDKLDDVNPDEYENRIIVLTDAMPNIGNISEESLLGMTKSNAQKKINTSFIGIGVDFNTELVNYITKIRGANYYSVNSSKEFKTRMDDEFEYMVTPLVFDLQLKLESKGYKIEKVYGSPEADESTGEIMKVNTLFPSESSNGETKGGLVLLKLKKISDDANLVLSTSYEDRNGDVDSDEVTFTLENNKSDFYQNTGIRKGIVLSRYANLLKNWLANDKPDKSYFSADDLIPIIDSKTGIFIPDDYKCKQILNKWEQQSVPLKVSTEYKDLFEKFIPYLESEMEAIGDDTMSQEIDLLKYLCKY